MQIIRKAMATPMTDAMAVDLTCEEASVLPIKPRDARAAETHCVLIRIMEMRPRVVDSAQSSQSRQASEKRKDFRRSPSPGKL